MSMFKLTLGMHSKFVQVNSSDSQSTLSPQSDSSEPSGQSTLWSQRTPFGRHPLSDLQGISVAGSQTVQLISSEPSVQSCIESQ